MSEEDQLLGANQLKSHLSIGHTYGDWGSFPGGSDSEDPACNAGGPGSIPESGRSPGDGNGNPLQYSCLENPMHRGAWRATVQRVTKESDTTATDTFTLFMGAEILSYIISTLWSSPPQPWHDFAGPRERGFVLRFHCDAQQNIWLLKRSAWDWKWYFMTKNFF